MIESAIILMILLACGLESLPKADPGLAQINVVGYGFLASMWLAGSIMLRLFGNV